jgi:hypothetical protein
MYSATSSLSSPSQQYPIKLASFLCLNFPTPHASSYNDNNPIHKSHQKIRKPYKETNLISSKLKARNFMDTANCLGSGQAILVNFLTAIHLLF